jgi:hypothetical protein
VSAAEVAFGAPRGTPWPSGVPLPRWILALLALSATVAALVTLAIAYAGPATYEDIARANGFDRATFHVPGTAATRQDVRYDVATMAALHAGTVAYVLGDAPGTPRDPTTRDPLFSLDEQRHLADVRTLFGGARAAAIIGLAAAAAILVGAARRGPATVLLAVRGAAVAGALFVAGLAAIVVVAFVPAFLAFHYVFFPQGNFLFDPATSNLLALYPEAYWYGVTLRIALSFLGGSLALAGVAHLGLRRRAAR